MVWKMSIKQSVKEVFFILLAAMVVASLLVALKVEEYRDGDYVSAMPDLRSPK